MVVFIPAKHAVEDQHPQPPQAPVTTPPSIGAERHVPARQPATQAAADGFAEGEHD